MVWASRQTNFRTLNRSYFGDLRNILICPFHKRRALSTKSSALPARQIATLFPVETGPDELDSFEESAHVFFTVSCETYQISSK